MIWFNVKAREADVFSLLSGFSLHSHTVIQCHPIFANFFCSSLSRSLLRLIFFSQKLSDENYSDHPFWDWVSENYNQVYCCMGNHEFYKYFDVATLRNGYCMRIRPNVHSFYNGIVHLYDTDIILSTLWGYIPLEEAYYTESVVTDFRRILYKGELMTFATFNEEHRRCLTFIKQAVADSDAKCNQQIFMQHF